jgi:8-oxo-dGTP diphosphatase
MSDKTFIDKLAYIYIKDQKVLVSLSKGKDTWYIPGGKREGNESDEQALTREVKEELNVDIRSESMHAFIRRIYGAGAWQA